MFAFTARSLPQELSYVVASDGERMLRAVCANCSVLFIEQSNLLEEQANLLEAATVHSVYCASRAPTKWKVWGRSCPFIFKQGVCYEKTDFSGVGDVVRGGRDDMGAIVPAE
jgi:hypothetical protein